jgi:hypothetical protein
MELLMLASGIKRYQSIINRFQETNIMTDLEFQKLYKGYYFTAPKKKEWYDAYFTMFEDFKFRKTSFKELLETFADINGSCEASFISKMFSTFDQNQVIIDSKVLGFFGLGLKRNGTIDERIEHAVRLFEHLSKLMNELLESKKGLDGIKQFDIVYPNSNLSPIKKLDFLLYSGVL